jgi:hypothetical protein
MLRKHVIFVFQTGLFHYGLQFHQFAWKWHKFILMDEQYFLMYLLHVFS